MVFKRSIQELLLESFFFALEAVYSGIIEAIFSKTLRVIIAGIGALEAAAVAIYARALKAAAVAVYAGALKAAIAVIARVIYLCLGFLQPLGVFMVLNLQFLR